MDTEKQNKLYLNAGNSKLLQEAFITKTHNLLMAGQHQNKYVMFNTGLVHVYLPGLLLHNI